MGRLIFAVPVAVLALLMLGWGVALADEVLIAGYTNGCFNCASPPDTSASQTDTFAFLTYTSSTFSGTSGSGLLALNGPAASPNVNNLGSFTLGDAATVYQDQTFRLRVTFTAPQGMTGGSSRVFTANLIGELLPAKGPGIIVDFDQTPLTFAFTDSSCEPPPAGGAVRPVQGTGQQTTCGTGPVSSPFRFSTCSFLGVGPRQSMLRC
jgi:hypothetical protein